MAATWALLCGVLATGAAGQAAGPEEPPINVFETEHFRVSFPAGAAPARALAARLEATYRANARLARELRVAWHAPEQKLEIICFGRYEEFRKRAREDGLDESSLGYFDASANRCVFFNFETHPEVARLRGELANLHEEDWARRKRLSEQIATSLSAMNERIVQHEAAHMVQANIGLLPPVSGPPTWLVEGLAQLFELPFVESGASIALSVNRYRLRELRQLHAGEQRLPDLRRLVTGEVWRDGADYSLAWALTNYLYVRQRERFAVYVRALGTATGEATDASRLEQFENVFGPLDEEFAERFDAYVEGLMARHLPTPAARPEQAP